MVKTLVLDPGHGGQDPGVVVGELVEKDMTLAVALEVRSALEVLGWPLAVELTRDDDSDLGLAARGALSKKHGADFVISLHVNSAPGDAQGAMAFVRPGDRLARSVAARVAHSMPDRLFRNNIVVHETQPLPDWKGRAHNVVSVHSCPSVCLELGFADDADDNAALRDPGIRRGLVAAILCGVARLIE
jgi:N-acetylmuramoyl-L-alanine amidase